MLPIFFLLILLPVDKRLKYAGLENDCFNHGIWIHDRIFINKKSVDIAFLGSSHTINGVNDELIENDLQIYNLSVTNLGYCRLGRNFQFALLGELLETKHPKLIILEVRHDEARYSHPVFPYIVSTKDVLLAAPFFNRDMFKDIYRHLAYKVVLAQDFLFDTEKMPIQSSGFGFATSSDTASLSALNEVVEKRQQRMSLQRKSLRNFYMTYPRAYLNKIFKLCNNHRIRICFLFLPGYGYGRSLPLETNTYQSFGDILIPPSKILDNPSNWYDEDHLNRAGADTLSKWVANELIKRYLNH